MPQQFGIFRGDERNVALRRGGFNFDRWCRCWVCGRLRGLGWSYGCFTQQARFGPLEVLAADPGFRRSLAGEPAVHQVYQIAAKLALVVVVAILNARKGERTAGGAVLGRAKYRSEETVVELAPDDRLRHLYVVGKTGLHPLQFELFQ